MERSNNKNKKYENYPEEIIEEKNYQLKHLKNVLKLEILQN